MWFVLTLGLHWILYLPLAEIQPHFHIQSIPAQDMAAGFEHILVV